MDKAKYLQALKLLENPDTAPEGRVMLNDLITADSESYTATQTKLSDQDTRIRDLQDRNAKLALRVTEGVDSEEGQQSSAFDRLKEQFDAAKGDQKHV